MIVTMDHVAGELSAVADIVRGCRTPLLSAGALDWSSLAAERYLDQLSVIGAELGGLADSLAQVSLEASAYARAAQVASVPLTWAAW